MKLWIKAIWQVIGFTVSLVAFVATVFLVSLNEFAITIFLIVSFAVLFICSIYGLILKVQMKHRELLEEMEEEP